MELIYDNLDNDGLYRAAEWFAGYAVMRWHLGYELGDLTINEDGTGEWKTPAHPTEYDPERLPFHVRHGIELFELGPQAPHLESGEQFITPGTARDLLAGGRRIFLHVPSPHHHALMRLASWYWEYWFALPLPQNPLEWPAKCLEEVWQWLTLEYCLTAFDRPMTREEALSLCVEEVKAVHSEYADLEEGLVEELCTRLTVSGEEITAYLNEWREATEFQERNAALTEVGEQLSCRHVPSALRWRADGQQECSACEVERAHQHWLEVERLQIYEEDRQRAAAGELLDCRHVPTNMVYGDDGYMWCRVCRPHGYDDAPGRAADTP